MIPVFGLACYLYAQTDLDLSMLLDKSFGVMVGVFSGSATLATAYIASLLFNDWRDQQKHQNALEFAKIALDSKKKFIINFNQLFDTLIEKEVLLEKGVKISDQEVTSLVNNGYEVFLMFHSLSDDLLNFLYVSDSNYRLDILLVEYDEDVNSFFNELNTLITTEKEASKQLLTLKKLTCKTYSDLPNKIRLKLIDVILKPLKLES